jgi:tetratricopeptide (TPR) repeat protein
MFRRRPLGRRYKPIPPGGGPRQALLNANRLEEAGHYRDAAEIFERLARGAHQRGILKHAPFLYLRAAHCYLLASQAEHALELMNQGLHLLHETRRWRVLHKAGERSVTELKEMGQAKAANEVQAWLDKTLQDHPEAIQAAAGSSKPSHKLPAKCPFCGATIRSDQVEWIDEDTAECLYCGSSVQAE